MLKQLIPLIDNFEAAKNSVKTENEGEERVAGAYLVSLNCLSTGTTASHHCMSCPWDPFKMERRQ